MLLEDRVDRVVTVIAAAFTGDYEERVPIEDVENPLLDIEVGINHLLDELTLQREQNEAHTRALQEHAERIAAQSRALLVALSTPIITRSVKLLGVTCLVTGIAPHVARQFVELDASTSDMHTFARVAQALEHARQYLREAD